MEQGQSLIPIFIGGTGRSGTTILKRVLRCHPEITGLDQELRLLIDPGGALDLLRAISDNWSPYGADRALHDFKELVDACAKPLLGHQVLRKGGDRVGISPPRYAAFHIGASVGLTVYRAAFDRLTARMIKSVTDGFWAGSPSLRPFSKIFETGPVARATAASWIREAILSIFAATDSTGQARCFVDDTPYNILFARELFEVFPGMMLLHIYRDPRDVVASHMTKSWGGNDAVNTAHRVRAVLERWREIKPALPADAVFEIALEDFSRDPKPHLARVCERLGIPYDARFETVALNRVNAGRWKQDLPPDAAEAVDRIFSDFSG